MATDDEYAYINPERTRTLLETPSGFALFDVDDDALKEADDTWVYFRDVDTAKNVMFTLGFVKFDDKTIAWDGQTGPSNELIRLIRRYCKGTKHLIVQSADIKVIIEEKLNVKCSYDKNVVDELVWGMKNVLRGFILQEKYNVTPEYRLLPVSKGLKKCLKDHLINLSTTELDADFIPKMGLLHYLNITLKQVPRMLRESYDDHVCRIGEHIKSNSMYARVLASILVPELAPKYDFCKMLSPDLALKIQEADKSATKYRDEQLTMHDREIIMGALSILLSVPKQRDDIMICVKRMEAEMCIRLKLLEDPHARHAKFVRVPTNLKHSTFRRTLLETPSGFAIFDVNEDVFRWPRHMWVRFIDAREAREVVLALGFVNVKNKSIARNSYDGPGQELSSLILNLCGHDTKLIVQDDALKSVIEEKLKVKCFTKISNYDDCLGDLMWGLKNLLLEFIPQEKDNVTQEYYLPMSKGLQKSSKSYGVNVSLEQMDREFVYFLGYLVYLDWTSLILPIIFRKMFDQHVCQIGESIKNNVIYAKVIAHILVPEFADEFDLCKLLPSDQAHKAASVARDLQTSGKSICKHDKEAIMAVCDYLSSVHENRQRYVQFLKSECTKEELPRIRGNISLLNWWFRSVAKASSSDKLIVDAPDSVPDQIRDKHLGDAKTGEKAEKTAPEVEKTMGENNSCDDKSVRSDESGLSCHDSFQKVPNVENAKPQQQPVYISVTTEHQGDAEVFKMGEKAEKTDPEVEKTMSKNNSCEDKSAHVDEFGLSCHDSFKKVSNVEKGCHLKTPNDVQSQQQPVYISETADNVAISKGIDNVDQQDFPIKGDKSAHGDEFGLPCHDSFQKVLNVENGCHLETPSDVKSQQQPVYVSETTDNLAISKGVDNVDRQDFPIKEGDIQAISSAIGPAVGAKVVPVCAAANITENVCSSVTMDDIIQKDVTSGTVTPSRIDLLNLSRSDTANEFNIVGSTNDIDEKVQNEKSGTDRSIEDAKGADHHHEGTTLHSTYNVDDSAYQHTLTDTTSLKLSLVTSTSSIRESKHEETSADITSRKTNATDTTDNIVEQKNGEHVVDPTTGIRTQCRCSLGDFEGKKQREAITEDPISGENDALQGTNGTENKEQHADTTTGPASEETKVAESRNVVVEERVKETTSEDISAIKNTEDAKGADQSEAAEYPRSGENNMLPGNVAQNTNAVVKGRAIEATSEKISTIKSSEGANGADQSKGPTEYSRSGENNMLPGEVARNTNVVVKGRAKETTSGQISIKKGTEDAKESGQSKATTKEPKSAENYMLRGEMAQSTNVTTSVETGTIKSTKDAKEADRSKATTKNPRSGENNMLSDTDGEDNKDQNADTTKGSASDENKAAQTTDVEGRKEGACVRAATGVGTMSFMGTQDKCTACDKTVHFIDLLTADGVAYHKTCFKCSHCKGILSMCSYSSMDGVLYCKTHFEQLFKETRSSSKKFTPGVKSSEKGELARAPSKLSSAFSGTQDKCAGCQKTVYPLEKLTLEGESYHKSCFKCSHGGCILTTSSYTALNGVLYCKIHFGQLFMEKGSYNHMKKKSTSHEVLPDVATEEQPPESAPPQDEKGEDN